MTMGSFVTGNMDYIRRPFVANIKPGHRVLAINAPSGYRQALAPLPAGASLAPRSTGREADLIHIFVSRRADLARRLQQLRRTIADSGVVWVSWPKRTSGVATDVTEDVVREVALPLDFVDVKVCAVSEVWSGLKLVIRKSERADARRPKG